MTFWTLRNVRPRALVSGCLLMIGCASSPTVPGERHLARAAVRLQQQSDADSLAAAGLFQGFKNRTQTIAYLARAQAAAQEWSAAQAKKYIALRFEQPREQDVSRARLIDAGKDLDPPS